MTKPPTTRFTTLWIGGSSSLARTYCNQFGHTDLLLSGVEAIAPKWLIDKASYVFCDLTRLSSREARELFEQYPTIRTIIVGVRPRLFAPSIKTTKVPALMLQGLKTLLQEAVQTGRVQYVLHISSVAAVDHLRAQVFLHENNPVPCLEQLKAPYDIFKRTCEHIVEAVCQHHNVAYSHLRLSAIFSDDRACIQCSALELQCRVGCYLPIPIDCNSSVNVARAIHAMVSRAMESQNGDNEHHHPSGSLQTLYYYTRPLLLQKPVPYGYYLEAFRQAYGIHNNYSSIWIPVWIVTGFVALVHWLAWWNDVHQRWFGVRFPYLDAADYLLQVSSREHSFDCSRFANDFPHLEEETILQCFIRRKVFLESYDKWK